MTKPRSPGIAIAQVFVENAHFEHRSDALNLPPSTPPDVGQVDVSINIGVTPEETDGLIRVTVSTDTTKPLLYQFKVAMIGLVKKTDPAGTMNVSDYLTSYGLSLVYPFMREAVANLTQRGRFGPIYLNTIDPHAAMDLSSDLAQRKGVLRKTSEKKS